MRRGALVLVAVAMALGTRRLRKRRLGHDALDLEPEGA